MIGLIGGSANTLKLGYSHFMQSGVSFTPVGRDIVSFTNTANNWYQVSFGLQFAGTGSGNWTVNNMVVKHWGSDGLTSGSTVATLATATFNPTDTNATKLETAPNNAWAIVASRQNSATGSNALGVDNIEVTAVPEPATLAWLSLGGLAALARRRRVA